MLKRFREAFHISKDGIISEQNMMIRAISTVVLILASLAAMSLSAFGYFSASVASDTNVIRSASFVLDVTVTAPTTAPEVTVNPSNGGRILTTSPLEAGVVYTFTLTRKSTSTATTGFCKFYPQGMSEEAYYTTQLSAGNSITFVVKVTNPAVLVLEANWGTSTYYATSSSDPHYLASPQPSNVIVFETPAASGLGASAPVQSAAEPPVTAEPVTAATEPVPIATQPAPVTTAEPVTVVTEPPAPATTAAPVAEPVTEPAAEPVTEPEPVSTEAPAASPDEDQTAANPNGGTPEPNSNEENPDAAPDANSNEENPDSAPDAPDGNNDDTPDSSSDVSPDAVPDTSR